MDQELDVVNVMWMQELAGGIKIEWNLTNIKILELM